jgi:histidinol-phosphatase
MYEHELSFASELADEADRMALSFFRGSFEVREKADRTPVTEADITIERAIRAAVHVRFPRDGVLGEEGGSEGDASRRWIVDPIDGTKNFADGVQLWATLIAFAVDDVPVVGVVSMPAIGERYEAARGLGARLNGEAIHVSRTDSVSRAFVLFGGMADWLDGPNARGVQQLMSEARRTRGFGDAWAHMLVARGSADVMVERELNTWDWAAVEVVVEEAGGSMSQLDGSPLEHGRSVLSTNGVLHNDVVGRLRWARGA